MKKSFDDIFMADYQSDSEINTKNKSYNDVHLSKYLSDTERNAARYLNDVQINRLVRAGDKAHSDGNVEKECRKHRQAEELMRKQTDTLKTANINIWDQHSKSAFILNSAGIHFNEEAEFGGKIGKTFDQIYVWDPNYKPNPFSKPGGYVPRENGNTRIDPICSATGFLTSQQFQYGTSNGNSNNVSNYSNPQYVNPIEQQAATQRAYWNNFDLRNGL
jgi:hypothetical protein